MSLLVIASPPRRRILLRSFEGERFCADVARGKMARLVIIMTLRSCSTVLSVAVTSSFTHTHIIIENDSRSGFASRRGRCALSQGAPFQNFGPADPLDHGCGANNKGGTDPHTQNTLLSRTHQSKGHHERNASVGRSSLCQGR